MGKPGYDPETLAEYFQPMSPELYDDPVCGGTLRWLAANDPDVVLAVKDVDRSQIRDALARTPAERLRVAVEAWIGIARLRDGR